MSCLKDSSQNTGNKRRFAVSAPKIINKVNKLKKRWSRLVRESKKKKMAYIIVAIYRLLPLTRFQNHSVLPYLSPFGHKPLNDTSESTIMSSIALLLWMYVCAYRYINLYAVRIAIVNNPIYISNLF